MGLSIQPNFGDHARSGRLPQRSLKEKLLKTASMSPFSLFCH